MLEAAIIICLGAIAFLLIKKKPSSSRFIKSSRKINVSMPSFNRIFSKKRRIEETEIIDAIVSNQEEVVSPKEIEEAKQSFDADDPAVAKYLYEANTLIKEQDYNKAEEKAIMAVSLDKHCDQAYAFIAYVALKKGEYENAKDAAETAQKCSPDNALSYAVIGEYFLIKEKYSEAIDNLLKAVMLNRNEAAWYGLLGQAYLEVRQFAKSAKAFKRASSLDLDNREYRRLASIAEEKQMSHSHVFRSK